MRYLTVDKTKRKLFYGEKPFFYLADTAWELIHRLTKEEAATYFSVRKKQGFTVIHTVILAEQDGLNTPNAQGHTPLVRFDEETVTLDAGYFAHLDELVGMAERQGLFLGLLPTWGDKFNQKWGTGPEIFTPRSAADYAQKLVDRYREKANILWILGGDRPLETERHTAIADAMGTVLKAGMPKNLISFHPNGSHSSADFVPHRDYIDFHMTQSGHGLDFARKPQVLLARCKAEQKPFIDGESRYEDHPICWKPAYGYWDDGDVRADNCINVLSGAFGVVYGHHAVWQCNTASAPMCGKTWREAIFAPGAEQLRFLKDLMLSRDFSALTPSPDFAAAAYVDDDSEKLSLVSATGKSYAYVYARHGLAFYANCQMLDAKEISACWFDPKSGEYVGKKGIYRAERTLFVPPGGGLLLVVDAVLR